MAIKTDHKVDLLFKKFLAGKAHRIWNGAELAPGSETINSAPVFAAEQVWNKSADIPRDRNPLNGGSLGSGESINSSPSENGRISILVKDGTDVYEKIVIPMIYQAGSLESWAYDWDNDGDASGDDLDLGASGGSNIIPFSWASDASDYQYELGWNADQAQALLGNFSKTIAQGEKDYFFDTDGLVVNFFALDDPADPSSVENYFGGDNYGETVTFLEGGSLTTGDVLYVICYRYVGAVGVGDTVPPVTAQWETVTHTPTNASVGAVITTGYTLSSDPIGEIEVSTNGVSTTVGVGGGYYFSNDGGTTPIASGSETTGDELYFDPTAAEFEIELDDSVEIRFLREV